MSRKYRPECLSSEQLAGHDRPERADADKCRRRVSRSRPFGLLFVLMLVGCGVFSSPTATPSPAPCGAPTVLTMIPGFGLARRPAPSQCAIGLRAPTRPSATGRLE